MRRAIHESSSMTRRKTPFRRRDQSVISSGSEKSHPSLFGMTTRLNYHSEQSEESFLMPDNELAIQSEPLAARPILTKAPCLMTLV
jgi:hypothetical protein